MEHPRSTFIQLSGRLGVAVIWYEQLFVHAHPRGIRLLTSNLVGRVHAIRCAADDMTSNFNHTILNVSSKMARSITSIKAVHPVLLFFRLVSSCNLCLVTSFSFIHSGAHKS